MREVVDAHIAQIEAVNPRLNAVIVEMFDSARVEADRKTEQQNRASPDELPPLFGVPFTVKELIAVRGMPHTAGVVARRHVVAEEDSPLVARMRAAGAVLVGLTNVSEAGLWLESHNRIYGRTSNARSERHTAGGSSGGEGAIIGAGGSPIGIGADIGGSIRNPSFFNGIVGHKPTGGLLPSIGHWPDAVGERGRYCVSGPMARRVADLIAAMEVFSPSDDPHRDADRDRFRPLLDVHPSDVTVHWYTGDGLSRVDPELQQNVEQTMDRLRAEGFAVEHWRPEGLRRAPEIWTALVSVSAEQSVRELLGNGPSISLGRQWLRALGGRSDHPLYSLVMASFDGIVEASASRIEGLRKRRDALRRQIEDKLGPRGVLVCLPYPRPAPRHNAPLLSPLAFAYCGIFNVLELPSTAVPTGLSREGLPLGVQVVGRRFYDPLTLWVAQQIEHITGGWSLPR